jgi:sodium/bile acid cotransporter 7
MLPTVHVLSLGVLLKFFGSPLLKFTRGEAVAAAFCASQKTLAFGLPLINTIFEGNPNLAAYCAPLMFVHPLQMTFGSLLLPFIRSFASGGDEEKLLDIKK